MKKLLLIIAVFLSAAYSLQAQTISAGPDTSICPGQNVTLTASLYYPFGAPPAPTNVTGPMGCDDCLSGWIPLGFTFNFYGNNYTQCLISSNSYITFSGTPNGGSPWSISTNLPSAGAPTNMIACPWWDSNPAVGGTDIIRYKTIGVAPNRKFVVEWLNLPSFSCGQATCFGAQIHLYETTNIIETHIFRYESCASWNGGRGIHGIQNAAGTIAHVVAGRNGLNAPWFVNVPPNNAAPNSPGPEGRRWSPVSSTVYNITTIPFSPVYMPNTPPAGGSITWSIAGGGNIGTGTSINVAPAATTDYVCSTNYSSCNGSVTIRDTVRVNMGSLPLTVSPNPTICLGDTATIYANSTFSGAINYTWTPNTNIVNNTLDTVDVFPTANTTYTVSATNGSCTNSATVMVTVNPLPVPTVTPVNPQICDGNSVNMTAGGGVNYTWSPSSSLSSSTGATVTSTPTTTTTYTVVVQDVNGCIDSISNTVSFFNNPVVTASSVDPGVCLTFSTQLNANGATSYQWSPAAGLSATNIANPTATPAATTNYQVIGTDGNGCKDTDNVTILVYPNPVVDFSAPVTESCNPLTVNFVNNSTITSGTIASYMWNVEGQGSSTLTSPSYTFNTIGDFDVTLTAISDMGCTDTLTIMDYLHSYSVPTAGFYATPNPATIGEAMVSFTNTSSPDAVNFLWDIDGMATISAFEPEYEFITADTFLITMIASTVHNCSDTVSSLVIVEDVSEIWIPNSFTPNADGLNESWFPVGRNLNTSGVAIDVEIFDRWGLSVFKSTDVNKPWLGKMGTGNADCPQDIYVYKVYFKNEKGDEFNYLGHINLIR